MPCSAIFPSDTTTILSAARMVFSAVRYDEQCFAPYKFGDRLLNVPLVVEIDTRSRLVQNDDGSVFQDTPCDGDALFLPARKGCSALADDGIEPCGRFMMKS